MVTTQTASTLVFMPKLGGRPTTDFKTKNAASNWSGVFFVVGGYPGAWLFEFFASLKTSPGFEENKECPNTKK